MEAFGKSENAIFYFTKGILKMKKSISLVLAATLAIFSAISASAASKDISVYLDGYNGADGQKINFDIPPQTINGRTMVPIRAIFEAMGANVAWDEATNTSTSTKDSTTVKMTLNSTTEYINGVAAEMDVTPVVIDGRTLAPARYVAEAFGYIVKWDEPTKSVLISKNSTYDISQVTDGTREHPLKLGSTITFDFWYYDEEQGNCTLTLDSYITAEEASKISEYEYYAKNNRDFIKGHIKLNQYSSSDECSDMIYESKAVTSKLKPLSNYTWYSDLSPSSYNVSLYSGGETDCYIPIVKDELTDGETVDYFTITYRSGGRYDDKKTVWFSLR